MMRGVMEINFVKLNLT